MSKYHELVVDLKNCKTEKDLMYIATDISANRKTYGLDMLDVEKLEQIGLRRYEELQRERNQMVKNKKQGFNNFD